MGDDLFRKRREKGKQNLRRRRSLREPYDRVLIVTEGLKTEPSYLKDLLAAHVISSANVEVDGSSGSDPMSVFTHAQQLFKHESGKGGDSYDRVYCVFDKDDATTYAAALDALSRAKPKGKFHAITSVPCFEYWLLLHFTYSTRAYEAAKGRKDLMHDLKKHLPEYTKGAKGIYQILNDHTSTAIRNGEKSLAHAESADTDNPSTKMHLLVEYLLNIKK